MSDVRQFVHRPAPVDAIAPRSTTYVRKQEPIISADKA
jgi:hypothetical protein